MEPGPFVCFLCGLPLDPVIRVNGGKRIRRSDKGKASWRAVCLPCNLALVEQAVGEGLGPAELLYSLEATE